MVFEYLDRLPSSIPANRILVHNVRPPRVYLRHPRRRLGLCGFRAWLVASADPVRFEPCACGWASELGPHLRTRRSE